jgi:glutamate-5-semialdehyde dehydrogenase
MSAKLIKKLKLVRKASLELSHAETLKKNKVLNDIAQALATSEIQNEIINANKKDIKALPKGTTPAFIDRLALNKERIDLMAESLTQVAGLEDPLTGGQSRKLENGLILKRVPSPLGVILMIFESRPNVAIEAFGLAFKAGNAIILRGGRESMGTTKVIYKIIGDALKLNGFSLDTVWGITDPDRKLSSFLLKQKEFIDVVVPRGGPGLIKFVVENSPMPIIKNDRGLCHVYVHDDADLDMALEIVFNSKTQRPSACNSMETVLVNKKIAHEFINRLYPVLLEKNVEWHVDSATSKILKKKPQVKLAKPVDWDTEYLDQIMNCRVVDSYEEAIKHIEEHGSRHSESIVTSSEPLARKFQNEIDAAVVYWNASTRFTDGFEFGLGGELGISTQKLHVRGPVGLKELTSFRWVVDGTGQVRK